MFRSAASGNWNAISTWETSVDGTTWIPALTTPTSANGAIMIRSPHTVTVTVNVNADEFMVNTGGVLSVNGGVTFTIDNGTGTDCLIDGSVRTAGTVSNNGQTQVNGSLQINEGGFPGAGTGTYSYSASTGTLVFNNSSGPYGVNNDNYWPAANGPRNVTVQNTGGIQLNVARTIGGTLQYAAGVNGANNLTLNGISQVNAGGFTSGSPTYGPVSTLRYNTGGTYGRNGEWLPNVTSGAGYPTHVEIDGNTTLDLPNGSPNSPFQVAGGLIIWAGSHLQMTPMTQPLTVLGSVSDLGTLSLSTALGGDIKIGGNFSVGSGGGFNPNGRAVFFNGNAAQTIARVGGGTVAFDYLIVDKTGGNLTLSNGAGITANASVNATAGNVLQILNAGGIDLNGQQFFLTNSGGNVFVSGGARSIFSSTTDSFFNFNGAKTVSSASGGTLVFGNNVRVGLNGASVNFGAGLTTVNGILEILSGGSVNTNAPTYGAASSLHYVTGGPYGRGAEWTATTASTFPGPGYPNNVHVGNAGTILDMGTNGGTATQFAANGTLSIGSGATFSMAQTPMTAAVTVGGNVSIGGTLVLSTAVGGDIKTRGDFTRTATGVFTPNNRAVFFEGAATFQNITDASGAISIPYVVINKSAGLVSLAATSLTALAPNGGSPITFQNATSQLLLNGHSLTVGGTFGSSPAGSGIITAPTSNLSFVDGGATGDMGTVPFAGSPQVTNLTVNRTGANGSVTLPSITATDALNLTAGKLKLASSSDTLTLPAAATVTVGTGYVTVGHVLRDFTGGPSNFTFPVGSDNGYTPVDANATTGAGSLSVRATGMAFPSYSSNALQRYWSLNGSGVTTNLTFHYLAGDVNVTPPTTEADYKVIKITGGVPSQPAGQSVDANAHTATVNGVSSFSDWTLAAPSAVFGEIKFAQANTDAAETNSGTHTVNIAVSRTGGSGGAVSVSYAVTDGTATTADNDYSITPSTGTLNWADGDAADKSIAVTVNGDTAVEPDEIVNLAITNPQGGATLGTPNTATLTITNDDVTPANVVYVDDDWVGTTPGTDPDGAGPATNFGYDAFSTIQDGVNGVATNGTVNVYAGTYDEDVNVNKTLSLIGTQGAGLTNVRGPVGGSGATIQIAASNVTDAGFTITRIGNNTTDWNNPGLNSVGVAIQGQAITGALIRDNIITGNRTGLDINNSNGHTVRNNVIDFNRTGFIYRNQTDNQTVVENFITNNWTVGVLFLDASGGTNSPVQSALHSTFSNNNISANWYGQIVDRQTGGSLPAPGTTNLKNFRNNWFGTTSPVVTTANSAEPGYAAQIPVAYGGTATPPGGQPDIAGPASANFKYQPFLLSGTDTNVETTPGRGTNGFQGQQNNIVVTPANQQGWVFFDDLPGTGTGTGSFEHGPGTPPLGVGSAFLQVDADGRHAFATAGYGGTRMDDVTTLSYSSYQNNNANTVVAISFQFDIDYDLNDAANAFAGRLVFEPYLSPEQGAVQQNVWQNWDALAGKWYGTRTTVTVNNVSVPQPCQPATPCTWQQVLASFPNAGVRNTPTSAVLFKAGGPWSPGFDGNVDNFQIAVSTANTTYDFEPLPQLSVDDVTHAEGNAGQTAYTFTVTLSRAFDQTVTVDYATADDSASAPSDYTGVAATQLVFNPGDTSKQFTVQVNGDDVFEPNEQFFVNLSNPSNATLLDPQGVGAITNDDTAPTISIGDRTLAEGDSGPTAFNFAVTLSNASSSAITVHYQTADGTATAGSDYTTIADTVLTIPAGDTSANIAVEVSGDTAYEADETFFVNLSDPSNATILDGQGDGTITNDDAAVGGSIEFVSATYSVSESGGPAQITVQRTGGTDGQATATFSTSDGTATAGQDYTAVAGQTVTFAHGEGGMKTVDVAISNDALYEGNETVDLSLTTTTITLGPNVVDPLTAVLTITDDEPVPSVSVSSPIYVSEPASGTTNAVFTFTLSGPTAAPVTLDYQTQDGTATAPDDYTAIPVTQLTFASSQLTRTVSVEVKSDALSEAAEDFTLALSNVSANATLASSSATGIITDFVPAGGMLISELRVRGANSATDEYVELYNNTNSDITVGTSDGSTGWALAALSDDGLSAVVLHVIPAGTIIPARSYYLVASEPDGGSASPNGVLGGYMLEAYAVPDATYTDDIGDASGVALFRTADTASFALATRFDAAGFTAAGVLPDLFREGTALASPGPNNGEYAFFRTLTSGRPQDTDDNAADFTFVSTDAASYGGVQSVLGAPGPQNAGSPIVRTNVVKATLVDPNCGGTTSVPLNGCARYRDLTSDPLNNSTNGTLSIRRKFVNNTGESVTRLRFRVVDATVGAAPTGTADMRLRTSQPFTASLAGGGTAQIQGLTLEEPPTQTEGGGLNSTVAAGTIALATPLAAGNSINVHFLLGIEQTGNFRFFINVEALKMSEEPVAPIPAAGSGRKSSQPAPKR